MKWFVWLVNRYHPLLLTLAYPRVGNAVVEGFKTLDQQFLKMARQNGIFDGSTALVSMVIQREDSILLLNANVGK